ncbi:hypothetical protein JQ617_02590 [Bradyrhizobium sp. KB893862 SZCCT0404]|uniref:hypothetical protein n=1 Tax=Bradyrhizobium sp. KB893862 SZCCT0404 TaxID=2807672 RepID=UPI001BA566B5|nr:hypothetical protein [Bradyrhizobium sp. KB893862 SZCCT0404]MBR1172831.1 hypothetical protein [Bradyrhizobium sp. KB893862 SZCCT0404]
MRPSYERQLAAFEAAYGELLLSALQACAKGQWGLFGSYERVGLRSPAREELLELGSRIERLRDKCGMESFTLHARFLQMGSRHSNTPGELKLAQQWLDELT